MKRLISAAWPHRRQALLGLGAIWITVLTQLPMPFITRYLVDRVFPSGSVTLLYALVGFFLALFGTRLVFTYLRSFFLVLFRVTLGQDLRMALFSRVLASPVRFIRRQQVGALMARISSDMDVLQASLTGAIYNLGVSVVTFAVGVATVLWINWRLGLLAMAVIPLYALVTVWSSRRVRAQAQAARGAYARYTRGLQEFLVHAETIKAFRNEDYAATRLGERLREYLVLDGKSELNAAVGRVLALVLGAVAPVALMLFGGMEVMAGRMTLGWYLAFGALLNYLYDPVQNTADAIISVQSGLACVDRMNELFASMPEAGPAAALGAEAGDPGAGEVAPAEAAAVLGAAGDPDSAEGRLSFDDVSFAYAPGRPVLSQVSFACGPRDLTLIVGRSGAGKTTLLRLVLGFEDPSNGRVRLDGEAVARIPGDVFRRLVAYVPQDPFLFADTVAANLSFGLQAGQEDLEWAARTANAHDFIMNLPRGYDTVVGEMGHDLSGGQKQRLALARAILRRPRVLLLDEAMSSIDAESRRLLEAAVVEMAGAATVLVVAHDVSLAQRAARVVVLDGAGGCDVGLHQELLARSELYRLLWERQFEARHGGSAVK